MKTLRKACTAVLALLTSTAPAWAGCVGGEDMHALQAASVQQRMMVAAFTCHDVGSYNQFVLSHRRELQQSDATLMSFFKQHGGGEAAYHTYKTHLANRAALDSARSGGFCGETAALFHASERDGSLNDFLDSLPANDTDYRACQARVITASTDRPFRDAVQGAAPQAGDARDSEEAAPVRHSDEAPPVRSADIASPRSHRRAYWQDRPMSDDASDRDDEDSRDEDRDYREYADRGHSDMDDRSYDGPDDEWSDADQEDDDGAPDAGW